MDRNNGGLETATPLKFDSLGHPCQILGTYYIYIHIWIWSNISYIQVPKVQNSTSLRSSNTPLLNGMSSRREGSIGAAFPKRVLPKRHRAGWLGSLAFSWEFVGVNLVGWPHAWSCWLGGGSKDFVFFHPYLRKIPILTHIFQLGWFNHQLVKVIFFSFLPLWSHHETTKI